MFGKHHILYLSGLLGQTELVTPVIVQKQQPPSISTNKRHAGKLKKTRNRSRRKK